jgi:two-component system sensor histidine kinase/response regulator
VKLSLQTGDGGHCCRQVFFEKSQNKSVMRTLPACLIVFFLLLPVSLTAGADFADTLNPIITKRTVMLFAAAPALSKPGWPVAPQFFSTDLQLTPDIHSWRSRRIVADRHFWNLAYFAIIIFFIIFCLLMVLRAKNRKLLREEKKFRNLFELSQDGVLLRRLEADEFYDCNQAMLDMLGYSEKEEFLRLGPRGIVFSQQPGGRDIEELLLESDAVIREKKKNRFEGLFKRKNGTPMYAEVVATLVEIDGRMTIQSVVRDMTVRKKMEDNLRQLSSAVESCSTAVIITDRDGNVEYVNPKFTALSGYALGEIEGLNPRFLKSGKQPKDFYQELWSTILEGREWHGTLLNKKKNGETFWVSTSISPVPGEDNVISHYVCVQEDITELKKLEAELVEAKRNADQANKAKGDFLARMSHEIRTPMNAVIGMNHLALLTDLTAKQRDYIGKAHRAAQSLLAVLNDILDFSKIEAGKLEFESIEFNLDDELEKLASMITLSAAEKKNEVLFSVAPEVPSLLVGDPLRLQQVLTNLVNNAIKFTDHGEIVISVESKPLEDNRVELTFHVKDNGIGLSRKQQRSLFESFTQADDSTTRKYGGTGLGLTICRHLVTMMGGRIRARSSPGRGSTFSFTLPFVPSHRPASKRQSLPEKLRGKKVLLVDDSRVFRLVLTRALEELSLYVDTAQSGEEALELVHNNYDLILMDWEMPGIDGIETARRILVQEGRTDTKIIMITAYGREEIVEKAEQVGIRDFLVKPVSNPVLVDAIRNCFGFATSPRKGVTPVENINEQLRPISNASVLLVEDNELNIQIATELLKGANLHVTSVRDGKNAVEAAEKSAFDIILMDIQMPVMDGFQATRNIRKTDAAIPVIAMTASAMETDRKRCLAAGMNDHVAKPISPKHLYSTLLRWIPHGERPAPAPPRQDNTPTDLEKIVIESIDISSGLRSAGGNGELYIDLLRKFSDRQKDCARHIRQALGNSDHESALMIVHTIKGLSGSIGALRFQKTCEQLETAIHEERSATPLLADFELQLDRLIESINQALPEKQVQAETRGSSGHLQTLLQRLGPNIEKRSPAPCNEILDELLKYQWPGPLADQVLELTRLTRKYKYREALPLLEQLQQLCDSHE